jgi:hypothetical protein
MIRPTTIPQMMEELIFEQAIAKEALRLAFIQHKSFATALKGIQQQRTIGDAFTQELGGQTLVNMMSLNMLIGSGGVLSHAPRRQQAALMLIDGFLPEGITRLAVDSIFMMPQLGVLSTVHAKAATQVFDKDCLIHLGTCIAPVGESKEEREILDYKFTMPDGKTEEGSVKYGEMKRIPMGLDEKTGIPLNCKAELEPHRGFDLGGGKGNKVETTIHGGVSGIIIDCRGRPFHLPVDHKVRVQKLKEWMLALDIYPKEALERL